MANTGLRFTKLYYTQSSLLAELFIGKLPIKGLDSRVLELVNPDIGV
jgi:hypothetical protein